MTSKLDDICVIKYIGSEPESTDIILSCSIFKLGSMYKDISIYMNGLFNLIKFLRDENETKHDGKYFLFIYHDHSTANDANFLKIHDVIKGNNKIKLCEYYCSKFIDKESGLHLGIFGMFIRSLPMYEPKYEKHLKSITDIDMSRVNQLWTIKSNIKKINDAKCDFAVLQRIAYSWRYCNYFDNEYTKDTVKFQIYLRNMYLPIDMMIDFLNMMIDNSRNQEIVKIIDGIISIKQDVEAKGGEIALPSSRFVGYKNLFVYGIDEYYLNKLVVPYIIKKLGYYGVIYTNDYLPEYVNSIIKYRESKFEAVKELMRKMLGERFRESDGLKVWKDKFKEMLLHPVMNNKHDYFAFMDKIKQFYYLLKEGGNNKSLKVDASWLHSLGQHVDKKLLISEYLRGRYYGTTALNVVLDNYDVYIIDAKNENK